MDNNIGRITINLKKGDIIKGTKWSEPILIEDIEYYGEDYFCIKGKKLKSNQYVEDILSKNDMENIVIDKLNMDLSANPKEVFLALETKRYRYVSSYDPLLAVNTSIVDPLPHQIEAVYNYVLNLPRIRFMIADDPGAGKTIMAGLIIKELKIRGLVDRILIVTPGHLKDQWRREMKDKFEENFVVVDRNVMNSYYGENVWNREKQIITSIDFAKRNEIYSSLQASHFDLIIVDEAHKMSAYRYGNKTSKSKRYKLGEILSSISQHLIFLTATPHKGDTENFRLFLDLLEPGFFATEDLLKESIRNKENPLFIRRLKEDLKDFDGKPLFLPRKVSTLSYNLGVDSPDEKKLYNELSNYVTEQYNKALTKDDKKRNIAFALVILQRRFASSMYALYNSLDRRKKKLENLLNTVENNGYKNASGGIENILDIYEVDDLSEEDRWKEEEKWETLSVAKNREELRKEIRTLERLCDMALDIIQNEKEIKLRKLKEAMDNLNREYPNQKIIIFTESRDTLEYLEKKIISWGYSVNTIHGRMKLEDRIKAEQIFKNETQVLVATEAAGEGINLQFCHIMINYDIPWNPNRLEQRMGRIHRYGQQKEVHIFNMVAEDTREGEVLNRLFKKLEEIKEALGSDKVFDVISEVLEGKNLPQLILDAVVNARDRDDILSEIDIEIDEEYIKKIKENLGDSLATKYIDYTRIKEMRDKAMEHKLIPEYTESFFKKAFEVFGGELRERKDGFLAIDKIPYNIKEIANDDNFKKKYGEILPRYSKITFDKDIAVKNPDVEFISFGHPLFEAVLELIEREMSESLKKGAVFEDPDGKLDGYIVYWEGTVVDGKGDIAGKRLFAFYMDKDENIRAVNPTIIWDLAEGSSDSNSVDMNINSIKSKFMPKVIRAMEEYKFELLKERERQANIKEKYGIPSLEHLINHLDYDIIDLEDKKDRGEKVDIALYNKKEMMRKYEKALEELKENIKYEKELTMRSPNFIGFIRVVPKISHNMHSSEDIERIGMEVAMEYERKNGRVPEDVSSENLGFDIRSKGDDGETRYIEVKARATTGEIVLTQNEMFKAMRFKDKYWLYVVENAAMNPTLYIINNPAENLNAIKKVESVRYIIPGLEWKFKGKVRR